jgi:hypothetical protein
MGHHEQPVRFGLIRWGLEVDQVSVSAIGPLAALPPASGSCGLLGYVTAPPQLLGLVAFVLAH